MSEVFDLKNNALSKFKNNVLEDSQLSNPKYKQFNYVICITFRILLGFLLMFEHLKIKELNENQKKILKGIKLCILFIGISGISIMLFRKNHNWKNYIRNIISNILSFIMVSLNRFDLAAGLLFVDTLQSLQLRHIKNLLKESLDLMSN